MASSNHQRGNRVFGNFRRLLETPSCRRKLTALPVREAQTQMQVDVCRRQLARAFQEFDLPLKIAARGRFFCGFKYFQQFAFLSRKFIHCEKR